MASFLENILRSEAGKQIINMAGKKMQDDMLKDVMNKAGKGNVNLGQLATSVISIIGLAKGALNKKR